jgi:L-ascorbate metabolism protein UlaG (beta-lactamase superfamily)
LWASWVIVDDTLRLFFSGDTGARNVATPVRVPR